MGWRIPEYKLRKSGVSLATKLALAFAFSAAGFLVVYALDNVRDNYSAAPAEKGIIVRGVEALEKVAQQEQEQTKNGLRY